MKRILAVLAVTGALVAGGSVSAKADGLTTCQPGSPVVNGFCLSTTQPVLIGRIIIPKTTP